jgi:Arc/MetJ family transcription regulator
VDTLTEMEDLLDGWPGSLVVVSHERYFLERVTDHVIALLGERKLSFLGGGVEEDRRRGPPWLMPPAPYIQLGDRRIYWLMEEVDMAKTLIDVDEQYLAAAQQALHTETKKDTVNEALREVAALAARRRDLRRLTSGGLPDLEDDDVMRAAWRQ